MRLDDPVRLRRMILWVMLGALGLTALLAIVGVIDNSFQESYRMIGSGIAAVAASGLLLAAGKLLDSPKNRRTALFIMGLIIVQFVLSLLAFWDPLRMSGLRGFNSEEGFDLMAVTFVPIAIPLGLFFYVRQLRGGSVAGLLGISTTLITFGIFLFAIWTSDAANEDLWETGWSIWFFAFGSAGCAAGAGVDRRHWRWIGMIAAIAALALGVANIWGQPVPTLLLSILIALAIVIGHANVLWLCKLKPSQLWLRWAATTLATCGAATVVYGVNVRVRGDDLLMRLGTAAGICALCATVSVAILAAFNRRAMPVVSEDEVEAAEISIVCPTCRRKQNVMLSHGFGEAACGNCGMKFSIRTTAPRCANCNYLLLMFRGDRCPECGDAIARGDREIARPSPSPGLPGEGELL
jgi:hypothetical protein